MAFFNRDFTDIHRFTADELLYIIDKSAKMKTEIDAKNTAAYRLAEHRDLIAALLFYENSTRTRTSFEIAAMRLGLKVTGFSSAEGTSVSKGESLRHTLDMYEAFNCDVVILRHPLDGSARLASRHLGIPVFNAGDGKHEHPTQTILDLFTIREHIGRLSDFDIGITGDLKYGRTVHSLVTALEKFQGVRLHLFAPPHLSLPTVFMNFVKTAGVEITEYESLQEMAPKVDILYQTRIQKERMPDPQEFESAKADTEFTMKMLKTTRDVKPSLGIGTGAAKADVRTGRYGQSVNTLAAVGCELSLTFSGKFPKRVGFNRVAKRGRRHRANQPGARIVCALILCAGVLAFNRLLVVFADRKAVVRSAHSR
jgi:aspartate carbamoyltransferase catalytic subunit